MQRTHFLGNVSVLCVLSWAASAPAYLAVPREPVPDKVALADCVVVGKITAVHDKPVNARLFRHLDSKTAFVMVDVEVSESFVGPKDVKKIRFGFIGFQVKDNPKTAPAVGQEGCFYAVKHCTEDFYVVPLDGFHNTSRKDFDKDVALTRRCGRMLSQHEQGLASKEPNDRTLTAYLLVMRYIYTPLRLGGKLEARPIDAEESKSIMLALAEADWDGPEKGAEISPQNAVVYLRTAAERGGPPLPKTFPVRQPDKPKQYAEAMKQWLKENADTYRIHQLVWAQPSKE